MKVGDNLQCIKSVNNIFGGNLFIKGNTYEVLHIDVHGYITLDHILYGNEFNDWSLEFVNEHFINIRTDRKEKLNKINDKSIL